MRQSRNPQFTQQAEQRAVMDRPPILWVNTSGLAPSPSACAASRISKARPHSGTGVDRCEDNGAQEPAGRAQPGDTREMHVRSVSIFCRRSSWPFNGSPCFSAPVGNGSGQATHLWNGRFAGSRRPSAMTVLAFF